MNSPACDKMDVRPYEEAFALLRAALVRQQPLPPDVRLAISQEAVAMMQDHKSFVVVPACDPAAAKPFLLEPSPQMLALMARAGVTA
jgi:hypothetical protein